MSSQKYIRWFDEIGLDDIAEVGGKTASLGELHSVLGPQGVRVPNGFAITAAAYRDALDMAECGDELRRLMDFDHRDVRLLAERAAAARRIVYEATGDPGLKEQITAAYRKLEKECGNGVAVAVRSSATAEDLPTASFAGQHESYLNVRGADDLFEACRHCFASLFTDRAIVYRVENGFDHFKVALSVAVMKMVRADLAASGVIFTLDTESGFRDVVFLTACYGLGENIVQGKVDPDEFYVHKPTFAQGYRAVLNRSLGRKQMRLVYARRHGAETTRNVADQPPGASPVLHQRRRGARTRRPRDPHRGALFGAGRPSDADGYRMGEGWRGWPALYPAGAAGDDRLAARAGQLRNLCVEASGPVLVTGRAVGEKIASGIVRVIGGPAIWPHSRPARCWLRRPPAPIGSRS